jgi:hypothetical protein
MASEIQIIYTDIRTRRIVRISDHTALTCPGELQYTIWVMCPYRSISPEVFQNPVDWEYTVGRRFKKHSGSLGDDYFAKFKLMDQQLDCLEQLAKLLNNLRYSRASNMFGSPQLVPLYLNEIELYRSTGDVGTLIASLVDDHDDLPVAIAEFEVKNNTYLEFLINNEATWNNWSRRIKQSDQPKLILDQFRQYMSS